MTAVFFQNKPENNVSVMRSAAMPSTDVKKQRPVFMKYPFMLTSSFLPKNRIAAVLLDAAALCAQKQIKEVHEMTNPGNIVKANKPRPSASALIIRNDASIE